MAAKKPPHPLRASEIERFERNLANWLNLDATDATYHRFQRILESQITILQICEVITGQGAVSLLMRMSEARREKDVAVDVDTPCGLRLV